MKSKEHRFKEVGCHQKIQATNFQLGEHKRILEAQMFHKMTFKLV